MHTERKAGGSEEITAARSSVRLFMQREESEKVRERGQREIKKKSFLRRRVGPRWEEKRRKEMNI